MTWSVIPQIMGLCSLTLEVHHRQVLWVYENRFLEKGECLKHAHTRRTNITNTILVLIFLLFFFLFLILVLCLTKAPIVHDRISIWWKLKAGVALLFHLGGSGGSGGLRFSPASKFLWGLFLTLHFIESCHPRFLAGFWRSLSLSIFCAGDSFAPSVHLIHQPGSRSYGQAFTSLTHFTPHVVYLTMDSLYGRDGVFTAASRTHILSLSSPRSLFRRDKKLRWISVGSFL